MIDTRVSFEEAISDKQLFKKAFDKLSGPQQAALKIFYGLPLDEEGLKHYATFTGHATFDDLGFVTAVEPITDYDPVEHDEAVLVFGRRSAKTSGFLAFVLAYEALLGGHTAWRGNEKQQIASFMVAQKLEIAQAILRDFVEPLISSTPLMEKELVQSNIKGITLKNGHKILPSAPLIKSFRYFAIPVVAMDEASFWYKDAESANPDFEVLRATAPAQAQFPYRKQVIASTVFTKEGIIWEAKTAGIYGRNLPDDDERKPKYKNTLVLVAPTPAMQNPLLDKRWFRREYLKDPEAYKREILNIAMDSVSGMFTEALLEPAFRDAPKVRKPQPAEDNIFYVAAMDPAFRSDGFTFSIGHYTREEGFIQDLLKEWRPEKGMKLNPATILDEIKEDLKCYQTETVYSDQYQLESLQQLALDRGIAIIGHDFTANSKAKLYGSFLQLARNNRVHLLRHHDLKQQLLQLVKIVGHGGYVRISAPTGKHDDLATVTVLSAGMAIRLEPDKEATEVHKEKTPYEKVLAKVQAKQGATTNDGYL